MTNGLAPEDFPVQIVDRILFTAQTKFVAVFGTEAIAQDIAARLNAGEMWRLGMTEPEEPAVENGEEDDGQGWQLPSR